MLHVFKRSRNAHITFIFGHFTVYADLALNAVNKSLGVLNLKMINYGDRKSDPTVTMSSRHTKVKHVGPEGNSQRHTQKRGAHTKVNNGTQCPFWRSSAPWRQIWQCSWTIFLKDKNSMTALRKRWQRLISKVKLIYLLYSSCRIHEKVFKSFV